ncbi:MAG: penicillin-binding protein 2 [Steroidobacteraceae bacterium]|jgi:penicillin-binding protein 2
MSVRGRIKDFWREQRLFEQRSLAASVVVCVLTLALFSRLVWLQVVQYDHYAELSQGNRVRTEPLPAPRGIIYDRNGTILAENRPAYQLELVPEQVRDLDATLRGLVEIGLFTPDDIDDARRIVRSSRPFDSVPIRLHLNDEEMARFAVHRFEFPGVDIRTRLARYYPQGELAVHALGHVGAISPADLERIDLGEYAGTSTIGKIGIEAAYENVLRGRSGAREILVNARGRSVDKVGALDAQLPVKEGKPGSDLYLTIDLEVQRAAEQAVLNQRAAIVAIDPNNGDVLALVSRPGFDPNLFARGLTRAEFASLNDNPNRPLFNRAVRGVYPPGSTIKPVVALAGLKHAVIAPTDSTFCSGGFSFPNSTHRFRDWRPKGHGNVDMVSAIAQSCDVYFYELANRLGVKRLGDFLGEFGLGQRTGIDIGGEKTGLVPSPEWKRSAFKSRRAQVWFPGETVIMGIGQGYVTSTPLQLAHMAGIVGMRGASFQPRLVRQFRDPTTRKVTPVAPKGLPAPDVGDAKNWDVAIAGMFAVTHGGTASRSAAGAPYSIAGKTGTAQVFSIAQNAKYDESTIGELMRDHAWFVAFAPVEAPKIAVAVLVENGRSGSGVAAPIARLIMDAYLLRKFPAANTTVTAVGDSTEE